jgi:aldose sugar dehydrogenase
MPLMTRSLIAGAVAGILAATAACSAKEEMPTAAAAPTAAPAAEQGTASPETRDPNNAAIKQAVAGQTRAPGIRTSFAVDVTPVATGLEAPWALELLPDGRFLVTERPGRMRIVDAQGKLSEPLKGLPAAQFEGQGGLLDVALDPEFASNKRIYWSYTEDRKTGN